MESLLKKNAWYIKPEFKKFSDKYGDKVSNTMLALVDNTEEGQEINPKAVVKISKTYQTGITLGQMVVA